MIFIHVHEYWENNTKIVSYLSDNLPLLRFFSQEFLVRFISTIVFLSFKLSYGKYVLFFDPIVYSQFINNLYFKLIRKFTINRIMFPPTVNLWYFSSLFRNFLEIVNHKFCMRGFDLCWWNCYKELYLNIKANLWILLMWCFHCFLSNNSG